MIEDYLNQTASLYRVLTVDDYNQPATATTTTIKCRKESKARLVRTATGDTYAQEDTIFTESLIQKGDKIDDRVVVVVETANDLDGAILFYRGYLS